MGLLKSVIILTFIMDETLSHTIIAPAICLKESLKICSPKIKLKGNTDVGALGFYRNQI